MSDLCTMHLELDCFVCGALDELEKLRSHLAAVTAERDAKDEEIAKLRANLDEERRGGKYYVKARVYGAIAAEYQKALQAFADRGEALAQAALNWRHSDRNGVPFVAVAAIGELLDASRRAAQAERDRDTAMAESDRLAADCVRLVREQQDAAIANGKELVKAGDAARAELDAARSRGERDLADVRTRLMTDLAAAKEENARLEKELAEAKHPYCDVCGRDGDDLTGAHENRVEVCRDCVDVERSNTRQHQEQTESLLADNRSLTVELAKRDAVVEAARSLMAWDWMSLVHDDDSACDLRDDAAKLDRALAALTPAAAAKGGAT